MPTYVYEVILEDGEQGLTFEVKQKMSDPPLTEHPITEQPVRRIIQAPNITSKYSEASMKRTLNDDKKLEAMGFTKYARAGDGHYEKHVGQGPDVISAD